MAFEDPARDFIGREALEAIKAAGPPRKLVGAAARGPRRAARPPESAASTAGGRGGEITSGTFSRRWSSSIALARVPRAPPARVQVDVRGKLLNARVVKAPFVRNGKILVS